MTVLKILAAVVVIGVSGWILSYIQVYSEKKYRFPPFNLASFVLMVGGWILFVLSIYLLPDGGSISDLSDLVLSLSFPEEFSNSIALVWLAGAVFLFVLVVTALKTNPLFALVTWVVQLLAALLIVPFLIFLIPGGKKAKKRRKRHKYV